MFIDSLYGCVRRPSCISLLSVECLVKMLRCFSNLFSIEPHYTPPGPLMPFVESNYLNHSFPCHIKVDYYIFTFPWMSLCTHHDPWPFYNRVDMPNPVTRINQTPIFGQHVVRFDSEDGCKKDM